MEQKDYYQILGVDRNADQGQLKEAYRKLAFEFHPDRNKDNPAAAARMKQINEAYAVLSDLEKRREYETMRQTHGSSGHGQFRQAYSDRDIFRGSDIHKVFEEFSRAFGFRGFEEIFRESYGPRYRTFEFRRPGASGRIFFTSSRTGAPYRSGSPLGGPLGKFIRYGMRKTWGIAIPERGKDHEAVMSITPLVARTGSKVRYYSPVDSKELNVRIPPNIRSGQKIRLKGMGGMGRDGGEPGDLYVKVRIRTPLLQGINTHLKRICSSIAQSLRRLIS